MAIARDALFGLQQAEKGEMKKENALEARLLAAGIPVLDRQRVRRHKIKVRLRPYTAVCIQWSLVLGAWSLGGVTFAVLMFFLAGFSTFLLAETHWRRMPYWEAIDMPTRLHYRITTAFQAGITTDQIFVEATEDDPFLLISKNKETAYIGAWHTNTEMDHI